MHIELAIDAIHAPGIEENQCNKDINRALLSEPESELESADADGIQLFDEQNAETVGTDKPDSEANTDKAKISSPVGHSIIACHCFPRPVLVVGRQCSKA